MDEIPEGLEDLLNSIRGNKSSKSSALAIVPKKAEKKKEQLGDEDIDPRILRMLGLEDVVDIDYDTYKTLLKEKMMAARMSGSEIPTEETELITNEFKRVKGKAGRFKVKTKKAKVNYTKFTNQTKKSTTKTKPTATAVPKQQVDVKQDVQEEEEDDKQMKMLAPSLSKLNENMTSILTTINKQTKLEKKADNKERKADERERKKSRESKLEEKSIKKAQGSVAKAVKPVKGLFDMIMDFFKNVLLGGALLWLMKFLKDPKKALAPFIDMINGIIKWMNGIITGINETVQNLVDGIFAPFNFMLGVIHDGANGLEDKLNEALALFKIFGDKPLNNIPDEKPDDGKYVGVDVPDIPHIPLIEGGTEPTSGMSGGGPVVNLNVKGMSGGGGVSPRSGIKIGGMGVDTQLTALQPGEFVMSKSAVQTFGADTLASMNAAGGGTNKPKMGKAGIQGFSGGGLVGGSPGSPSNPKQRKVFLHWSGGFHNSTGGLPYHQTFSGTGKPASTTVNYGADKSEHTAGANSNSVGLAAAAMGHQGMSASYYDEKRGWAENPLTNAQTTAMAKEAAGLLKAYGQSSSDVDKNVWTHGEWERHAVKTGKLSSPVQRWDLDTLSKGAYNHPGGFFSTQQVRSEGGNQMRAKIKSFMTGISAPVTNPEEHGGGVTGSSTPTPVPASTAAPSASAATSPVGTPTGRKVTVKYLPPQGTDQGAQPNSLSQAAQTVVPAISASDPNNFDSLVVKSIYNIAG
jgi:hypothetical protein|tara:strand:- start:251 stop:2482 length:2232 start_codon:yes stop_codon:yes gene_type:complete